MTPPCKDCRYRKQGCHGFCRSYKEFAEHRSKIIKIMHEDGKFNEYLFQAKQRMKKREGVMRL